jgi:hypothetical protein
LKNLFFLIVLISFASSCSAGNTGEVVLQNKSEQNIDLASIKICKDKFEFKSLNPGSRKIFTYKVKGDCHFNIDIKFASGRTLSREVGYVTTGIDFEHKIFITSKSITYYQRDRIPKEQSGQTLPKIKPWSLDLDPKSETNQQH